VINACILEAPFRCCFCRSRYGSAFSISNPRPFRREGRIAINRRGIARVSIDGLAQPFSPNSFSALTRCAKLALSPKMRGDTFIRATVTKLCRSTGGAVFRVRQQDDRLDGAGVDGDRSHPREVVGLASPTQILLVDDNPDALEALGMLLEMDGHTVRTAGDGLAALEMMQDYVPEAALIDIGIPGIDGFQLANTLRARPALESTLLVALTGYGAASDKSRALAAGFDVHLTKPLSLDKLRDILSRRAGRTIEGLL
jgi:CheY-like chemotaxis protein